MKLFQVALRSTCGDLRHQWRHLSCIRRLSSSPTSRNSANDKMNYNSFESERDFSQRFSGNGANNKMNYNSYESERDFSQQFSGNGANNRKNYNSYESGGGFSQRFSGNGGNNKMNYNSNESERDFSRRISGNDANNKMNYNSYESEQRIFGDYSGNNPEDNSFFGSIDKLKKERNNRANGGDVHVDDLDESFDTLNDGLEGKLKNAAKDYFEVDWDEIENSDDYSYRHDLKADFGSTYDIKDLDLREPAVSQPLPPYKFEVTTAEVLRKADFRNVRFLSNFLTDAGIIIKRSSTKISAKAQRKVAREIKTARAFGLMPFTTMGQTKFIFGRTRDPDVTDDESDENDHEGDYYVPDEGFVAEPVEPLEDPILP